MLWHIVAAGLYVVLVYVRLYQNVCGNGFECGGVVQVPIDASLFGICSKERLKRLKGAVVLNGTVLE